MKIGIFFDHLLQASRQQNEALESIVQKAAAMGISFVDIDGAYWMANRESINELLAENGIKIGCVDGRFDLAHDREVTDAEVLIRTAAQYGIDQVLLIPGFVNAGEDRQSAMERIAKHLRYLMGIASDLGVHCSLEDYDNTAYLFGKWQELAWYIDHVPGLEISFDTGNFAFFGQDAMEALQALKDHVCIVHAKDRRLVGAADEAYAEAATGAKLYPCAVGSGSMPIREALDELQACGFNGGVIIEHFGSEKMYEDMCDSYKWMKEYLHI